MSFKHWGDQKVHLGFSVPPYGKARTNFLASSIEWMEFLTSRERVSVYKVDRALIIYKQYRKMFLSP